MDKLEMMIREFQTKPYLMDFIKEASKWSKDELHMSIRILKEEKTA